MEAKPAGWGARYGGVFADDDVVAAYHSVARSRLHDSESFARQVREAVAATLTPTYGRYELDVIGTIIWGVPTDPSAESANRRAISEASRNADERT